MLFAYGSLLDQNSRQRSLPQQAAVQLATVHGYQRSFCQLVNNGLSGMYLCTRCGRAPQLILSLGIYPQPDASVNGLLVEVNDWSAIDQRERGYRKVRLPQASVRYQHSARIDSAIYTYLSVPRKPVGAVIPSSYLKMVRNALLQLGEEQLVLFDQEPLTAVADTVFVADVSKRLINGPLCSCYKDNL